MKRQKIYIDGKWVLKNKAKVSVFDHGFLYGDGVFEGIRAYSGVVFRLRDHLTRLYQSAGLISLKIPMQINELERVVELSLVKNGLKDAYIRLLVTRGVGDLGLDPRACSKPSIIVIADKLALFPKQCYESGLSAVFAKTKRNLAQALDPRIKSMNYLNNILAKIEANTHHVPEAIMLNNEGYVSECTGDNVFYVKGGSIFTSPVSAGILEGITRDTVMKIISEKTNYRLQEKLFTPSALLNADEVFFTGTAAEVIPVTRIDSTPIGDGKPGLITKHLITLFHEAIRNFNKGTKGEL